MSERTYGRTRSGKPINDEMIEGLAEEAERGYEPGQLQGHRRGPGRPPLGDAAKVVESVRLDPSLSVETAQQAAAEGVTVSEIIRRALRQYLQRAQRSKGEKETAGTAQSTSRTAGGGTISNKRSLISGGTMAERNARHVVPKTGGGWDVEAPGSSRASSHHDTQADAVDRARQIVKNSGGGEVVIHDRDGSIRDSDTVAPGNDPNPPRDQR